ncbi:hypothetical protein J3E68DRAFT_439691 [Trichoderma sp. SZMC 28012]
MLSTNKAFLHIILAACLPTAVTASCESTTVLDNFIFAMAPLGILTGIVSAIRGGGIAEAELCSSTSRDVVFGRPKILEIVYDPELEKKDDNESENNEKYFQTAIQNGDGWKEQGEDLKRSSFMYIGAAIVGFLAQTSVLKNGNSIDPWAFPFIFVGTIFVCFGITKERVSTLYVVQPGNQVRYMTSWKVAQTSDSSSETRKDKLSFNNFKNPSEETSVLVATFLAVTLLMSVIRALLRTQRLSIDENVLRDRPDEMARDANVPTQNTQPGIRLAELTGRSDNVKSNLSNSWGNDLVSGRLQAQQLKKAIEGIGTDFANISWDLNLVVGEYGKASYEIQSIKIDIQQPGSVWTVDRDYLEAIIGLWSWSVISDPRTEEESFGLKTSTAAAKPMYWAITAGTENETERSWREIQFWIERPDIPLSNFNRTTILANEIDLSTLFGLHGIDIRNGPPAIAATKLESKHIPTFCSHDIYQSFLHTISAYLDFGSKTTHQLVTKIIDCFEASGLGSRQDASLIIIPTLQNHSLLPRTTEAIPAAYKVAENFRKSDNFKEAEGVLQWAWGVMTELNEPRDMVLLELGELYRHALFSDQWQGFGKAGINWMDSQHRTSGLNPESVVVARYVELEKRPREPRTGQHVLEAISRNDRIETLWSISQLHDSNDSLPTDEKSGRSVLSFLCEKGWLELVKTALEIGSVVDSIDKQGRTPLSYAAEEGNTLIVNILIEANALPIIEDSFKRSPLSYAAGKGQIAVMERLLSDPRVHMSTTDAQSRSPLHWAAANGHHDAIKYLVDHGASVHNMDRNEFTPLVTALLNSGRSRLDRRRTADLLLQMKSKLDYIIQGQDLLEWALRNSEFMCVEYILENHSRNDFAVAVHILTPMPQGYEDESEPEYKNRHSTLSLPPDFQSGFKIRSFHDEIEEETVTLKTLRRVARGDFAIEVAHVNGGSQQWTTSRSKGHKIIDMVLDEFQELGAIEKLVIAAALNQINGLETISILFDRYESQIQLTENLVEAAACNGRKGKQIIEFLLNRRGDEVPVTEDVVIAAIENKNDGERIIKLFFDRRGDQVPITENVVFAAIYEDNEGERMIKLLLDRWGDQVPITEYIVKTAAINQNDGDQIIKLFLNRRGDQVPITENIIKAAAGNYRYGKEMIELFLNRRGDEIPITEDVKMWLKLRLVIHAEVGD